MLVCSCSSKTPAEVLEDSLEGELESFERLDDRAMSGFSESMDLSELEQFGVEPNEFSKDLFGDFSFAINTVYVGEDEANVNIDFIAKDYIEFERTLQMRANELSDSMPGSVSDEAFKQQYGDLVFQCINATPLARYTDLDIAYEKENDTWIPVVDISYVLANKMINP